MPYCGTYWKLGRQVLKPRYELGYTECNNYLTYIATLTDMGSKYNIPCHLPSKWRSQNDLRTLIKNVTNIQIYALAFPFNGLPVFRVGPQKSRFFDSYKILVLFQLCSFKNCTYIKRIWLKLAILGFNKLILRIALSSYIFNSIFL